MATKAFATLASSPSHSPVPPSSSSPSSKLTLQLRHDLANLKDKDPDTRKRSMEALKSFIEGQLDAKTMVSFLDQVSMGGGGNSSSNGGSSSSSNVYAISLFEEVARVHTEAVVPFIPRIMSAVIRCLSCPSGNNNSNSLHDACSRVVSSLARYVIGPSSNSNSNINYALPSASPSNVLYALCQPLLGSLGSNIEHVTVGSAICLQSLVEAENWKHAGPETVSEVCHMVSICFLERGKRTPAHIRLMAALAKFNPSGLQIYGSSILKLASDIVVASGAGSGLGSGSPSSLCSVTWQHRVAAAHLMGTILCFFGPSSLSPDVLLVATKALETCRHDKAPMVRQAVTKAISLYRDKDMGSNDRILLSPLSSNGILESEESPNNLRKRGSRRKSLWKVEQSTSTSPSTQFSDDGIVVDLKVSNTLHYGSGESTEMLFGSKSSTIEKNPSFGSPLPPSSSSCSSVTLGRSPLYPAKQYPVTPSIDRYLVESEADYLLAHIKSPDSKENLPLPLLKSDELGYIHFNSGSKISKGIEVDNAVHTDPWMEHSENEKRDRKVVEENPYRENYAKCDSSVGPLPKQEDEEGEDPGRERCAMGSCVGYGNTEKESDEEVKEEAKENALLNTCHNDKDQKPAEDRKPPREAKNPADQVSKNHVLMEDLLSFSTPRRLTRPSPQSGSSLNCSMEKKLCGLDVDFDTISESGWSVRDNPIAGDCSDSEYSPRTPTMHSLVHKKDEVPPLVRHSFTQGSTLTDDDGDDNTVDGDYVGKSSRISTSTGHLGLRFPAYERLHDSDNDTDDDDVAKRCNPNGVGSVKGSTEHKALSSRVGSYGARDASLLQRGLGKLEVYGRRLGRGVEVLLFGSLVLVLVFATMITILNIASSGQNNSHELVPT